MATDKSVYIPKATALISELANMEELITGLKGVWDARKYGTTTDPITTQDMLDAHSKLTPEQFTAGVLILAELRDWLNGVATTTKDRKTTINICREDL